MGVGGNYKEQQHMTEKDFLTYQKFSDKSKAVELTDLLSESNIDFLSFRNKENRYRQPK